MIVPFALALGLIPGTVAFNPLWSRSFGVPGLNQTFDYVVVGGGTAGLTVASRLAENSSASVAVIEAGSFREIANGNYSVILPFSWYGVSADVDEQLPITDWGINTVPQPQLDDRILHYTQGFVSHRRKFICPKRCMNKCLGGGSAWNNVIYHRGTSGSYDQWAKEVGDQDFAWNNILPYFERSVHFTPPNDTIRAANATARYNASSFSPHGGPVQVSIPNYAEPISSWFPDAFSALGWPAIDGFTGGDLHGFSYTTLTMDPVEQIRSSAETGFLRAELGNTWPLIYANTLAKQILFDRNKTATGVKVTTGSESYILNARKEVIVSSGVMRSPQLLMVSGIGPAKTLQDLNITVIKDSPGIGQNMWDSCAVGGVQHNVTVPTQHPVNFTDNPTYANEVTHLFLTNRTGPLTTTGQDMFAWEKLPRDNISNFSATALSDLSQFASDWPEVEFVVGSAAGSFYTSSGSGNFNVASVSILLTAPVSRGNVTINSTDTNDNPIVSTNWLLEETDMEVAVAAYKRARQLWAAVNSTVIVGEEQSPGPDVQTDAELRQYIKENLGSIHHGSSTCRMGMKNDTMAVVDSHGRVFGVNKLRVIDSSSFRFTPPGHTVAATYAHAERLVAFVKSGE